MRDKNASEFQGWRERLILMPLIKKNLSEIERNLVHSWSEFVAPELLSGTIAMNVAPGGIEIATEHNYARPCGQDQPSNVCSTPTSSRTPSKVGKGPLTKPKLPLVFLCGMCSGEIKDQPTRDEEESIECSECKVWLHKSCVRVQLSDVNGSKQWSCPNCDI